MKKISLDDLTKVESSSVSPNLADVKESVAAIVKVTEPNYVPKSVKVRAQIDEQIFTCELTPDQFAKLEKDKKVMSISVNKKLHGD